MAELEIKVSEEEIKEVLEWAARHGVAGTTDHEDGTYEEGVSDGLAWALGIIDARPDQP